MCVWGGGVRDLIQRIFCVRSLGGSVVLPTVTIHPLDVVLSIPPQVLQLTPLARVSMSTSRLALLQENDCTRCHVTMNRRFVLKSGSQKLLCTAVSARA